MEGSGRVMVDEKAFARASGQVNAVTDLSALVSDAPYGVTNEYLEDSKLHLTWPTLHAFSFSMKTWGLVCITHLRPVRFRDDAFELLVLDERRKTLVKSLVRHCTGTFEDIIAGISDMGCTL
jgi:hypothetical protein